MKKAKKQSVSNNTFQQSYEPGLIEKKWQSVWNKEKIFSPDMEKAPKPLRQAQGKPFYNLMMFPYPSAEGMHVGNMYAFTGADVYGRFMRMQGLDVFEPIGLDGFGIHSENYAFKTGRHPMEQAEVSEKNFYRQLHATGNSYDWTRTVETYKPNYYKWTQWLFVQMFKAGLAYRKKAEVNWCPSCKTVLADEQVVTKLKIKDQKAKSKDNENVILASDEGARPESDIPQEEKISVNVCERCETEVIKKELEQWFFRITEYAERLLNNIEQLDWTEKVKIAQRNWIGKKVGINITYQIEGANKTVVCFTTRPDTNFGATFIVVGPEYPGLQDLVTKEQKKEVEKYVKWATSQTDADRIAHGRKKTGVFTGSYAINNLNGTKMPIWVSDFVLGDVGTGAVVGVPGHDIRDFEFAKAFDLPIIRVVVASDNDQSPIEKPEQVQEEEGKMVNSEFLNDLDIHVAKEKIMDYLVEKGWGEKVTTYHLRDWLISRQRYWGPPIPMIYCEACFKAKKGERPEMPGWYAVPDDQLPVELPKIDDYKPLGFHSSGEAGSGQAVTSPLGSHPEFYGTKCPSCGGEARRETDVSDTFLDSSWYFFRYLATEFDTIPFPSDVFIKNPKFEARNSKQYQNSNVQNSKKFRISDFDIRACAQRAKWLPVDMYIGGAEHSVLHLLYSRFVTMALNDLGFISFDEPYSRFFAHGLLVKEGAKMSKSKGNVVIPDEYIKKFGADTLRCYLMFLGPFNQGGDFYDTGIEGMNRFLKRVWRLIAEQRKTKTQNSAEDSVVSRSIPRGSAQFMHKTIKKVTEDIKGLRYNTALAAMMEWYNYLAQQKEISQEEIENYLKLLAPFAPHMTEELWQGLRIKDEGLKNHEQDSSLIIDHSSFESIHLQPWPSFDPKMLVEDVVKIVVQVNGKVRDIIEMKNEKVKMKNEVEEEAKKSERVRRHLEEKTVKDVIYVEGKIINFVTS